MLPNIHIIDQPQVFCCFFYDNFSYFFLSSPFKSSHIHFFMGIITYIINMLSYPFDFIEHGFYDQIYIT